MKFSTIKQLQRYCQQTYCCIISKEYCQEYLTKNGATIQSYEWNDEWELPEFAQKGDALYPLFSECDE